LTYLPLFPPIFNVNYQDLANQEKQLMLFDALPKDYIDQIKKANQVPLEMPLDELRTYALNIEETSTNTQGPARALAIFMVQQDTVMNNREKYPLQAQTTKVAPEALDFFLIGRLPFGTIMCSAKYKNTIKR
jgi:hypothetical protein